MSKTEKKTLRLKILVAKLAQAECGHAEAHLQKMRGEIAFREQEAEFEFNQGARDKAKEEWVKDKVLDRERQRPCMFMYTEIFFDDDKELWACQHNGVTAHGDTPSIACENFDHLWVYG